MKATRRPLPLSIPIPLSLPVPPARLYKYRGVDDKGRLEAIIVRHEMYLPSPLELNDPFDCRFRMKFRGNNQVRRRFCEEMVLRYPPRDEGKTMKEHVDNLMRGFYGPRQECHRYLDAEGLLKTVLKKQRLCSLTEVNDDVLMWSHYADSHKGVCLEFSRIGTAELGTFYKVEYRDEVVVVNPISLVFSHNKFEISREILLTKSTRWEHEREWRSISFNHGPGPDLPHKHGFNYRCLTGVILGCSIKPDDETKVRSWVAARRTPIPIYRAVLKKDEYGLAIEKADK